MKIKMNKSLLVMLCLLKKYHTTVYDFSRLAP